MNYEFILKDLKPSKEEKEAVNKTAEKVIDFINESCESENIGAEAMLVGSVAKKTWLSGKSDIDVFIHFPLDTNIDVLKEKGLYLGYKTNEAMEGKACEHYASHPYLTCEIDGFEIDFVPCYLIKDGSELKSAVDRTILHTKYIQENLEEKQVDEVLLLKKFMDCVKTYGSEFKTGGFAGYLCELLILKYGTFENLLKEAQYWKYGTIIDLEDYKTYSAFNDPLITIDPTDKNRNVGAALRLERMVDFILASRNFMNIIGNSNYSNSEKEEKIKEFFKPLEKKHLKDKNNNQIIDKLIKDFKDRQSQTLIIEFSIPEISADSLHPQLYKTIESLCEKIENEEFSVFKYDYWTNEIDKCIFIIELNVFTQNKYKIHKGPKIWPKKACDNFIEKWKDTPLYPLDDFLVLTKERPFKTAKEFIKYVFTEDNIRLIKVGKNIKNILCTDYQLIEIEEFLSNLKETEDNKSPYDNKQEETQKQEDLRNILNFFDDFLNPGQYLKR